MNTNEEKELLKQIRIRYELIKKSKRELIELREKLIQIREKKYGRGLVRK